jgi:hypothetical protein
MTWAEVQKPDEIQVENILAMDDKLWIISKNSIHYKPFGKAEWQPLPAPDTQGSELVGLAVNPRNSREIFVTSSKQVFFTDSLGENWETINFDQRRGEITGLSTDGDEIIIASTQGIWSSGYQPITWIEIKNVPANQRPRSILVYDKFFYIVLGDKNIYTGDLNKHLLLDGPQAKGEFPMPAWPDTKDDVESISATTSVVLVGNEIGLKCYPLWTFLRWEWWYELFGKTKPCQNDITP